MNQRKRRSTLISILWLPGSAWEPKELQALPAATSLTPRCLEAEPRRQLVPRQEHGNEHNKLKQSLVAVLLVILVELIGVCSCNAQESYGPLSGVEAAQSMIVPEGFHVTLFAGEPDVKQPIGFCLDDRGRLWIAEAYNYPNHGTRPGDRIVILEDTDHDGRFDQRKVFYDQLNYVTGIEVGFGGAWVMSPPNFYFIPDRDRNDVPDNEPEVLLDGFGNHANSHNLANGFAWGPDGWLYGTHGRTNFSRIGKPGVPDNQRIQYDGGVYRYHPVRHVWEPFADGTTNPWGIDWDDHGEAFVCNCVNPHLFHIIPGAHYEPWRNRESSRYAYQRIDTIADHLHFVGVDNVRDGLGSSQEDAMGGGHAHCGTMIYLGDNWPEKYRNSVFMNNIHGKRINHDWLRRSGSGYTASHAPDLMRSRDPWHVGVTLQYGPDGSVFVIDWSDTGECHHTKNTQRETGRVFKISYGEPSIASVDLERLSAEELVQHQLHHNDWFVRHARRLLQERASKGDAMAKAHEALLSIFHENEDVTRKLRSLWCLWSMGGIEEAFLLELLGHPSEHVRTWAVRFICETSMSNAKTHTQLEELAISDDSARVRLYLASMLQRISHEARWPIATALLRRSEDANDHNIPLMIWYAIEPLIDENLDRFVRLTLDCKFSLIRSNIARRVSSHAKMGAGIVGLNHLLQAKKDTDFQESLLDGILQGLEGRRAVKMPSNWTATFAVLQQSPSPLVRQSSMELALIFDDPKAISYLRNQVDDVNAEPAVRQRALSALIEKKAKSTSDVLLHSISDSVLQRTAIRGLAEFDHADTVTSLLNAYEKLDFAAKQDVLQTLASRAAWGHQLLDALESKRIGRGDFTAFTARQLQNLGDERMESRIKAIWGELRSTPEDTVKKMASYKKRMTTAALQKADLAEGRAIFQKNCSSCHKLFDAGGAIGPDLTGAQRMNIDYLLENILDPSASVSKDYQIDVIQLDGGRTVTGLVIDESENALTLQTANERLVVPKEEVEQRKRSNVSLMPDGMLNALTNNQVIDLIAYLSSPKQVPLVPDEARK